ncbi:MAG: hypothetical protein HOW73_11315 [Polyangiaceae bacterium]|nr:hypothetical protein [Polyangiaceae bacterium]
MIGAREACLGGWLAVSSCGASPPARSEVPEPRASSAVASPASPIDEPEPIASTQAISAPPPPQNDSHCALSDCEWIGRTLPAWDGCLKGIPKARLGAYMARVDVSLSKEGALEAAGWQGDTSAGPKPAMCMTNAVRNAYKPAADCPRRRLVVAHMVTSDEKREVDIPGFRRVVIEPGQKVPLAPAIQLVRLEGIGVEPGTIHLQLAGDVRAIADTDRTLHTEPEIARCWRLTQNDRQRAVLEIFDVEPR